jgi:dinuclear metal center YbgI/SA1388 family protein
MKLQALQAWLDALLEPSGFSDYCPNGLQVEGQPEVTTVVTGVSASQALFEAAIEQGAQAIIVHHGLFWKNQWPLRVRGAMRQRLKLLLENDVSLFAYHLPLDAHPEVGNNAQLAQRIGLEQTQGFGPMSGRMIGISGTLNPPLSADALADRLGDVLGARPALFGGDRGPVQTLGIISGGAGYQLTDAIDAGLDAYLTGEPTESALHLAQEEGVAFYAGGHYRTERFGVQAVGARLQREHGLDVHFVELPNPV